MYQNLLNQFLMEGTSFFYYFQSIYKENNNELIKLLG